MSTHYTIFISEAQRAILEDALEKVHGNKRPQWDLEPEDEPHALRALLEMLPIEEVQCPGGIHTFVV